MLANLGEPYLPSCEIVFGQAVKYTLPWTPEGQVHELNVRLVSCLNQLEGRGSYFADTRGFVGLHRKNSTVYLPPFDGDEDRIEEWCRRVRCSISDE